MIGNGTLSLLHDAQMPSIIIHIFKQLNIGDFRVRINNRKILLGFFAGLGLGEQQAQSVLKIVDDLEKLPHKVIITQFEAAGLDGDTQDLLFHFLRLEGKNRDKIKALKDLSVQDQMLMQGIEELETVLTALENMGVEEKYI